MRILFMAQCYAPEDVSAAVLITELAADLVTLGHRVTVVTGAPNYPQGRVFKGYRNSFYAVEMLDGVRVIRTWSYISPSKKLWPRLLHYGTYSATAFYGGLFAGHPDVIVSYSPPLPLGLSAWLLSRIWHIPWILQLEDLYPDAAIAAGMLANKNAITLFFALERFLYQNATHISVIAGNFKHKLSTKGVPTSKITVIPVWADPDTVRPLPKQNMFRQKNRLTERFVLLYAGNIGLTSCLEDILDTAEILQKQPDIQFVIVGEGVKKGWLASEACKRNLKNILFLPYQPRAIFPEVLASADLNLVTLAQGAEFSSLPSKVFNAMASARPILAVTPAESEVTLIVQEAGCGWNVPPASPDKLSEAIVQLKAQEALLIKMGQNGRSYFEKYYTRNRCIDAYEKLLTGLCPSQVKTSHAKAVL